MPIEKFESWDDFYMGLAFYGAMKSEDKSTHSGAVIVNEFNRIVSFGYNGLPTGVMNTENKNIRPDKYFYYEHAERNAIYNTDNIPAGCRVYVNWFPCTDCVRGIIQKRMNEVIYHAGFNAIGDAEGGMEWTEQEQASHEMLIEAKVKITPYFGRFPTLIKAFKSGKTYEL